MSHQWGYKEKAKEKQVRKEASDGRNKESQINTCPQTCKHTVRKGIKPIKCVGWVNCTKRDMLKRQREGGRGSNGVRRSPRELGKRMKEDWSWDRRPTKRRAGRKQRRVRGSRGGVPRQKGGRGPECKKEESVETWEERREDRERSQRAQWWREEQRRISKQGWELVLFLWVVKPP